MATDRWDKAQRLFEEARKLPETERAAFLDERAGGDAELRAEVDRAAAFRQDGRSPGPGCFERCRSRPTTGDR